MASFPQPPTRIKLRRDAIIHAIAFHDEMYAVGDDEALTVVDATTDHSIRRFEDMGTVLSVCFVGDRVAVGTLLALLTLAFAGYAAAEDAAEDDEAPVTAAPVEKVALSVVVESDDDEPLSARAERNGEVASPRMNSPRVSAMVARRAASPFSRPGAAGLLLFTRLLKWVLLRWHDPTVAWLAGLMAGSLAALWPFRKFETLGDTDVGFVRVDLGWIVPPTDANTMGSLIAFLIGSGLVAAFIKYDQAKAQKKGD